MSTLAALVRGRVVAVGGEPQPGARVVVTQAPVPVPEIALVTDDAGLFQWSAPAPGEYVLEAFSDQSETGPAVASFIVPGTLPVAPTEPPALPSIDPDDDMSNNDPGPLLEIPSTSANFSPTISVTLTFQGEANH